MTELELLRHRRELVLLSAQLQRATAVRRLQRIETHPARIALGLATRVASVPLAWRVASGAVALVARMYRRRPEPSAKQATT